MSDKKLHFIRLSKKKVKDLNNAKEYLLRKNIFNMPQSMKMDNKYIYIHFVGLNKLQKKKFEIKREDDSVFIYGFSI